MLREALCCVIRVDQAARWDRDSFSPPPNSPRPGRLLGLKTILISSRLPSSPHTLSSFLSPLPTRSLAHSRFPRRASVAAPEAFNIPPSCCCCCVNMRLPPHPQLFLHPRLHTVTSKRESSGIDSRIRVVGVGKRSSKRRTPPSSGVKSSSGESGTAAPINQTCYFFSPHIAGTFYTLPVSD